MFYHGSPKKLNELLPPTMTGNIRKSEEYRSHHRDKIFLSTDKTLALEYAGSEGYLYVVRSDNAQQYNQAGKKKPTTNASVFVADSVEILHRFQLSPRRRGQRQQFSLT